MTSITITLGLPPKELSPNSRTCWWVKAMYTKGYREAAWATTFKAIGRAKPPRWMRARATATFYFATNRKRDFDNADATLKACWDGIAQAGLIADDAGLEHGTTQFRIDPESPRVQLFIEEIPA